MISLSTVPPQLNKLEQIIKQSTNLGSQTKNLLLITITNPEQQELQPNNLTDLNQLPETRINNLTKSISHCYSGGDLLSNLDNSSITINQEY